MPNIDQHHKKPCANCGHRNLHGELSGCIANRARAGEPADWCDCTTYAPPTALPYAGSSGSSGSSTSRERAERRDAAGLTGETQKAVYEMARTEGADGITVAEARGILDAHHGTVSGALSNLHQVGILDRLEERRSRCQVYVLPENVNGRATVPHQSNRPKAGKPDAGLIRAAIVADGRNLFLDPDDVSAMVEAVLKALG